MRRYLRFKAARAQLEAEGWDFGEDFHTLGWVKVDRLCELAREAKYRPAKLSVGSTARMFYQCLQRAPKS